MPLFLGLGDFKTILLSLSLSFSLSLSPLYPFHLSLSLLSLHPSLYLSFYLSFSLSPSLSLLSIILYGVSNGRFRPCCIWIGCKPRSFNWISRQFIFAKLVIEEHWSRIVNWSLTTRVGKLFMPIKMIDSQNFPVSKANGNFHFSIDGVYNISASQFNKTLF